MPILRYGMNICRSKKESQWKLWTSDTSLFSSKRYCRFSKISQSV